MNPLAEKKARLALAGKVFGAGKVIPAARTVELLETVIRSGDRIIHEGDNQKQGDFLAECLST